MELRLPFIPQCIPRRHDTLVVDISRASGIGEENETRVFEFLRVHRNNVTVALWRKCKIYREVEYPCQTDMLPERRTMKCATCEVRVSICGNRRFGYSYEEVMNTCMLTVRIYICHSK